MKILTGFGSKIISSELNKKFNYIFGENYILSGFTVTGETSSAVTVSKGTAVINGAILIEDQYENIIGIPDELNSLENIFLRMEYKHNKKNVSFKFVSEEDKDLPGDLSEDDGYIILAKLALNTSDQTISNIEQINRTAFLSISEIIKQVEEVKNGILSIDWKNIKNKPDVLPASDVYPWAKQPQKPTYSAGEITGLPTSLPASDVYPWAKQPSKPSYSAGEITGLPSSLPASDVYPWAKQPQKPTYSASEITGMPASLPASGGNADTVKGRDVCNEIDSLKNNAVDFKTKVASAVNSKIGTSLSSETPNADLLTSLATALSSGGSFNYGSESNFFLSKDFGTRFVQGMIILVEVKNGHAYITPRPEGKYFKVSRDYSWFVTVNALDHELSCSDGIYIFFGKQSLNLRISKDSSDETYIRWDALLV